MNTDTEHDRSGVRISQMIAPMPPERIAEIRARMGLTQVEMAALLELNDRLIRRLESPVDACTHMPPPARVCQLLQAYASGWRPADYDERLGLAAHLRDRNRRHSSAWRARQAAGELSQS